MASSDFIPDRDAQLRNFAGNFNTQINANPVALSLTPAQAAAYTVLFDEFNSALQLTSSGAGNSSANIISKNQVRQALIAETRELARIIRAAPNVTDDQRISLGLSLRDSSEGPRLPAPPQSPIIFPGAAIGNRISIRIRSREEPTRRGKPHGVIGATIFTFIGLLPPADPDAWHYHGQTTRHLMTLHFPSSVPAGATVWIRGQWINPRLIPGPLSAPIHINLPGSVPSSATDHHETNNTDHSTATNEPMTPKLAA